MSWWESAYSGSPPWDIGRPQPEIKKLFENGEIPRGQVLDIGCGLADNSIFLAKNGYSVTCMDITSLAIEKGRARSAKQNVQINFLVGDALKINEHFSEGFFNAVVDSGLFHSLDDEDMPIFARQVSRVLVSGGKYFMLCFSDKEPGDWGPKRVSQNKIQEIFSNVLRIYYIRDAFIATKDREKGIKAYLTSMTKIKK